MPHFNQDRDDARFSLSVPFIIDGDAYSDRDRAMFVAGYEFCQVHTLLMDKPDEAIRKPIHKENEDRLRVLANKFGRRCVIESTDETWSHLLIESPQDIHEGAATPPWELR